MKPQTQTKTENQNFKDGSMCYSKFSLCTIERIVGGQLIVTGKTSVWGAKINECFPDEPRVAEISKKFQQWDAMFRTSKFASLNVNGLRIILERLWIEMCNEREDEKRVEELTNQLNSFGNSILDQVQDDTREFRGVKIFL